MPKRSSFYESAKTKGFKDSYLEKTGLIIFNEEKVIDRFRDRIIFPIKSLSGRVLGFGGRTTISSKKLQNILILQKVKFIIKVKFYMEFMNQDNLLLKMIYVF